MLVLKISLLFWQFITHSIGRAWRLYVWWSHWRGIEPIKIYLSCTCKLVVHARTLGTLLRCSTFVHHFTKEFRDSALAIASYWKFITIQWTLFKLIMTWLPVSSLWWIFNENFNAICMVRNLFYCHIGGCFAYQENKKDFKKMNHYFLSWECSSTFISFRANDTYSRSYILLMVNLTNPHCRPNWCKASCI